MSYFKAQLHYYADTNYQGLVHILWAKDKSFTRLVSFHTPATSSGIPGHLHFWPSGYKYVGSHHPLSFSDSVERLTNLRKVWYLWLQFYYKGYKSQAAKWRDTKGKFWERIKCEASMSAACIIFLVHWCASPARKLTQTSVSRIFIGFHYVDVIVWIIDYVNELSLHFLLPPSL